MVRIPINGTVESTDGQVGISTQVIIDPTTRKVTHLVVSEDEAVAPQHWLVPISLVSETTRETIYLNCTIDELDQLEPFEGMRFIEAAEDEEDYAATEYMLSPFASPAPTDQPPLTTERIPPGELTIHRGAIVQASDGYVGRLSEFLLDPDNGEVTHIILEEGHLWGKQEITIPVSAVAKTLDNMVFLSLLKEEVASLPAIPVERRYRKPGVVGHLELIAAIYDQSVLAAEALSLLKEIAADPIRNAAILEKDETGKTFISEAQDVDAKQGRLFGAVSGGLIGLLGGPIGAVIGALAGAVTGGLIAKHVDMGFSDVFLRRLQELLQPGNSALLVLVESQHAAQFTEILKAESRTVLRHTLADEIFERLDDTPDGETEEPNAENLDS